MKMILTLGENSNDEKNKGDLVLTPAGLRPKKSVRHVGPKEAIYHTDNGTYSIVPVDEKKSNSD